MHVMSEAKMHNDDEAYMCGNVELSCSMNMDLSGQSPEEHG